MEAAEKFFHEPSRRSLENAGKELAELTNMGVVEKILVIAPANGQICMDPTPILDVYTRWATGFCEEKVTIVCDTMHHSTQKMAHTIAEGLIAGGMEVRMYYLHEDERSEIVKDILTSTGV